MTDFVKPDILALPKGTEALAVISAAELAALQDTLADALKEIASLKAAVDHYREGGGDMPGDVALGVFRGDNPIRVWREYRRMTATALAEAAGLSTGYINDLERGRKPINRLSLESAVAIADALHCEPEQLLPMED